MAGHLHPRLAAIAPELIVLDKGGTLIGFHDMWRDWAIELTRRLEATTGTPLAEVFVDRLQFDPWCGEIAHDGPFATSTMAELWDLTAEILSDSGLGRAEAEAAVASAWFAPDAVSQARPLADLPALLEALRDCGLNIAVATVDDRAPTEATFTALKIAAYVDALICGDDGLPVKPAPDMVVAMCQAVEVPPQRTAVVGDSVTDLQMGRAAAAGLLIAVPTGVASREVLAPHADLVLESVAGLVTTPTEH
jgi:phosphoglycolate phosphatase